MAENEDVAVLVELAQDTGKLEAQAETAKEETEELKQELEDVKQKITWGEDERRWLDQWVSERLEEINRRLDALENGVDNEEELDNLAIQTDTAPCRLLAGSRGTGNQAETEATVIEAKPVEAAVEKKTQKKLRWGLI